jgi:hypothetical protein
LKIFFGERNTWTNFFVLFTKMCYLKIKKTDPLVTCIIWNFKTKFAKYDCYKLFGGLFSRKTLNSNIILYSNRIITLYFKQSYMRFFAHVGFGGTYRVKNTQFHQVISFTIITSNKWELSGRTHFRQVYLNTKAFINWVYFKRIIAMCFCVVFVVHIYL